MHWNRLAQNVAPWSSGPVVVQRKSSACSRVTTTEVPQRGGRLQKQTENRQFFVTQNRAYSYNQYYNQINVINTIQSITSIGLLHVSAPLCRNMRQFSTTKECESIVLIRYGIAFTGMTKT